MLKITLQIQENKKKDACDVKLINPKDTSKASESEKTTTAMVINAVTKALQELSNEK